MVSNMVNSITVNRILHIEPDLLVKHEQDQVVQEWCQVGGRQRIVPAASDQNRVVAGQVSHRVSESGHWRCTLCFDRYELSVHNFVIDDDRLEVSQLVLKLSFLIFAAKEVDTVQNRVRLKQSIG